MSAHIRYLFKVDPDTLSPEDFAQLWREAKYIIDTYRLITKDPP